jgi:hypothetical protein
MSATDRLMTRTAEDWGRLAVSLPGWRWMPGMLAKPLGYRALRVDGEGRTWGVCQDEQTDQDPWPFAWDWLPDPDDPATLGCVLALARETADDPGLHARCMLPYAPDMSGKTPPPWVLYSGRGARLTDRFDTEKEALLWALRWPNLAESGRMGAE